MRRFQWRHVICLALAAYVLADVCVLRGPLWRWGTMCFTNPAVLVGDEKITRMELEAAMRDHLWRSGKAWAALPPAERNAVRHEVLERLVNERLIRVGRVMSSASLVPRGETTAAGDELAMFAKQFDTAGNFESRLGLQGMKESELAGRMRDALDDQGWIESKIAGRIKEVSEKDVSEWLRVNKASQLVPPVYGVAHIYLTTHDATKPDRGAEIREIHRRLKSGEATFEQLALLYSDDERSKKVGGALGWCARGRMPDDFMNVVEKLKPGETSEPVETKLGWHVIRLMERNPGRVLEIDEVKSEVRALLRDRRRDAAVRTLIEELRARVGRSLVLNDALIEATEPPP